MCGRLCQIIGMFRPGTGRWWALPGALVALVLVAVGLVGCRQALVQPPQGPAPTPITVFPRAGAISLNGPSDGLWQGLSGYTLLQEPFLLADPSDSRVVYVCSTLSNGPDMPATVLLQRTTDGGQSWQQLNVPVTRANSGCSLSIDPTNSRDLFLSLGFAALQKPVPGAALFRSTDWGLTWHQLNQPGTGDLQFNPAVPLMSVGDLLVGLAVPWNPAESSSDGHRLFVSQDGGQTWTPLDGPLVQQGLMVLAFTLAGEQVLAATVRGSDGQVEFWEAGVLASDWTRLSAVPDRGGNTTLSQHVRLFNGDVAFGGRGLLYYVDALAYPTIAVSMDGGFSWQRLPDLSTVGQFVPLLAGANQFLYGYLLSNAPISSDQATAEGVVWNVTAGRWQAATTGLPLSSSLSVTPDLSVQPFGTWWALNAGGPPNVLRFVTAHHP